MTSLPVTDVTIDVYDPSSFPWGGTADRTIEKENIKSIELSKKVEDDKDTATITLYNDNIDALDSLPLHSRAVIFINTVEDSNSRSIFSAYPYNIRGTGKDNNTAEPSTVTFNCFDFVMGRLSNRLVTNAFRDVEVFGNSDAIVDTIIDKIPEVDLGGNFGKSTKLTIGWNYSNVLSAIRECAQRSGAIISSNATTLFFDDVASTSASFKILDGDIQHPVKYAENDDLLKNRVVVVGGQGQRLDEENTGQTSTVTVDDTTQNQATVDPDKNYISKIEVYTALNGSSTDNIRCRIQKTSGGTAIAPGDQTKDIKRQSVASTELVDGGFTEFNLNATGLPDTIAIIMDSTGSTGQDVGVDGSSNLIYKVFYSYPVVSETTDAASQDEYFVTATREETNAQSEDTARQIAKAEINKHDEPERTYSFTANRNLDRAIPDRVHKLEPADVVTVDDDQFNISDDKHVVTQKTQTITTVLETELTLQDIETITLT